MTDNIISLVKPVVNEKAVQMLEYLLTEAKSGELVSIVVAAQFTGRDLLTNWVMSPNNIQVDTINFMGVLTLLQHELAMNRINPDVLNVES